MECYICHRGGIARHEFARHVGSHLAANNTGIHAQLDPSPPAFSYDEVSYDHNGTVLPAHSTPPRLQVPDPLERDYPVRPVISDDELQSGDLQDVLVQFPTVNHQRAHLTPSHSPVRAALVPDHGLQHGTQSGRSTQPNAFEVWLQNSMHDSQKYTTIDEQSNKPDSFAQFIQTAEVLRRTTKGEVVKIVEEFQGFSCSDRKTCLELVQKAPIFPGLVAFTYTHLSLCPRRGWFSKDDWSSQLSELEQLVESWARSGDIQCILSCNSIKNRLLRVLHTTRVRPDEHKCNSGLLNGAMVLDSDILNLAALVASCVAGPQKNDILDQRGDQVADLIELFHSLLEANVKLDGEYRRHFFNPLIQFSKESGYCPRGIYLEGGAISGLVSESQGGFGFVYKGSVGSCLVAVKALKRDVNISLPKYNQQVSKEAIVWRHLRHPNCLPLYGIYRMPTEGPVISAALVSPWMNQGTLLTYLERNPKANQTQLILDVVRGLDYLHSMRPHVAHRDIKPDNILITNKGRACLADFGLVSAFDMDVHFHTAPSQIVMGGTYSYMAPEIFDAVNKGAKAKVNKRACDMYALGCTIYAVYTGEHPFYGMPHAQLLANVVSKQRPKFPKGKITLDMWSFVENLWDHYPSERLTAQKALRWMETKAHQEGVDSSPAPLEEEWEWKLPHNDKCLWSVYL